MRLNILSKTNYKYKQTKYTKTKAYNYKLILNQVKNQEQIDKQKLLNQN